MISVLALLLTLYTGSEFARVGAMRGEAQIWRYGIEGSEWLTINNLIGEGDEIETYEGSALSLEFSDGSILSVDENTSISFERIEDDRTYLYLYEGSVRVFAKNRVFGVMTGSQNVYVEEGSIVRIDISKDFFATKVYRGKVKLGNQTIYSGSELVIDRGRTYYGRVSPEDSFDKWAKKRERYYYGVVATEYVPVAYYAGYYELRAYGRWVYVRPYGWVWVPQVRKGWRPYTEGHWVYRPGLGWVWVSYEPWGWMPYRYGTWTYVHGYGWVWIPGTTFVGAYVEWYYGPDWVAWAPLDYYGRPIIVINNITIVNVVRKDDFVKPVYRYKAPTGGVYKQVYTKVEKPAIVKEVTKFKAGRELEKPVFAKEVEVKREVDKPSIYPKSPDLREKEVQSGVKKPVILEENKNDRPNVELRKREAREEDKSENKEFKDNRIKDTLTITRPVKKEGTSLENRGVGSLPKEKKEEERDVLYPERPKNYSEPTLDRETKEIKTERPSRREQSNVDRDLQKPSRPMTPSTREQEREERRITITREEPKGSKDVSDSKTFESKETDKPRVIEKKEGVIEKKPSESKKGATVTPKKTVEKRNSEDDNIKNSQRGDEK